MMVKQVCDSTLRRATILLSVALVASACAPPTTAANPLVTREIEDRAIPDLPAEGVLAIVGSCLAFEVGRNGEPTTIIWPDQRTTWDPETQTVTMTRVGGLETFVASVGEVVALTGTTSDSTRGTNWVTKPADDCPTQYLVTH